MNLEAYGFQGFSWVALVMGTLVLGIGIEALLRERFSSTATAFFAMILPASFWLFSFALMYSAPNEALALRWAKTAHIGIAFIPFMVYCFTVKVLRVWESRQFSIVVFFVLSVACVGLAAFGGMIEGVYEYPWGYYTKYAPSTVFFLGVFAAISATTLRQYWLEFKKAHSESHHNRIRLLFIAFCFGYTGAIDFLPAWGVPIWPVGFTGVLGFIGVTSFLLRRHRLVDVTPSFAVEKIMGAIGDALLVLDSEDIVRVANDAACDLLGSKRASLLGRYLYELELPFVMPDKNAQDRAFDAKAAEGDREFRVSDSYVRDHVGQAAARVILVHETTLFKKVQADLADAESRYQVLYRSAEDPILTVDEFGRFCALNAAAETLIGATQENLTGKIFVMSDCLSGDCVPAILQAIREGISGAETKPFPVTLKTPSGPRRFLATTHALRRQGKVSAVQFFLRPDESLEPGRRPSAGFGLAPSV